jgi:RNA polymerase sigma factor (sigma-70 family)
VTADERGGRHGRPAPSYSSEPEATSASLWQVRAEWISFYDTEYRQVIGFMMKNGASLQDAQDAVHEAFVESWDLMQTRPGNWKAIANQRAWIRTVALRKFRRPPGSRIRPQLAAGTKIPDVSAHDPEPGELTAQTQAVLHALRCLDEGARRVMAFRLDGFSTDEIAAALDITEQRVRDLMKKARRDLKRILAASTEGSEQR